MSKNPVIKTNVVSHVSENTNIYEEKNIPERIELYNPQNWNLNVETDTHDNENWDFDRLVRNGMRMSLCYNRGIYCLSKNRIVKIVPKIDFKNKSYNLKILSGDDVPIIKFEKYQKIPMGVDNNGNILSILFRRKRLNVKIFHFLNQISNRARKKLSLTKNWI